MKVVPGALRRHHAFTVLGLVACCSLACTSGVVSGEGGGSNAGAGGPPGQPAGGNSGSTPGTAGGSGSSTAGAAGTTPGTLSNGGPKLRILTQAEYTNSLTDLLGAISAQLDLPPDTAVAGFAAIGGAEVTINASAVQQYETATLAATAEVFGNATRWQKIVGCQPKVDLSDACVVTFIQTFGKRAFRRSLDDTEVQKWLKIGKDTATLANSAAQGLAAITSGLLQSPYFLYRIETNKLDVASGRLKYDGPSMATRLSYLLTGHTPSDALLTAAAAGQLDTADGVRTAATTLLNDASALDRMAGFFNEYAQIQLVQVVQKSPDLFPSFNPALQNSMQQATQMFIKNIVLAAGSDMRSFFDSDQTFVDANLAPIYGVSAPASGFAQIKLAADAARAGILGQAGVIAGHSQPDHNSPTRRGVFIATNFLCQTTPPPPPGVIPVLSDDPTLTARQKMDLHRTSASCASCHQVFDPPGFGLEHFDSIGKYRATENGLTIDTTGTLDGVAFDGIAQLGGVLKQNARVMSCMMNNFYRNSNGIEDASSDSAQIDALGKTLASKGYVWRDLISEFVVSDAFRSAPAAVTAGNQ